MRHFFNRLCVPLFACAHNGEHTSILHHLGLQLDQPDLSRSSTHRSLVSPQSASTVSTSGGITARWEEVLVLLFILRVVLSPFSSTEGSGFDLRVQQNATITQQIVDLSSGFTSNAMRGAVVESGATAADDEPAASHAPLFACVKQANKTVEQVDEPSLSLCVCLRGRGESGGSGSP